MTARRLRRALRQLGRPAFTWFIALSVVSASLPPDLLPSWLPLTPKPAAAETLVSPRYVSAALMPNGHVGLVFASGDNGVNTAAEVRFLRYTDEHTTAGSVQLSTAGPAYPQLAVLGSTLVAAYVDTRSPNAGRLIVRTSTDSGATWSAESYPFGAETFDAWTLAPRLVASRDGQTLYLFSASSGAVPQYRSTTDLATWTAAVPAGDASMRVAATNNCGSAGQECYRAHAFSFVETAVAGRWLYIAKSDSGCGQSGRGTQYGALGGSWSAQIDLGGSGGLSGGGESTATAFLARNGDLYYLRALGAGENVYSQRSTDNGQSWGPRVSAYAPVLAGYVAAAPVGLYVPGYALGEYVWYAGFGGSENALRVVPLWTAAKPYVQTGSVRLLGSAGSDLDQGSVYPYNFGDQQRLLGAGAYTTSATDLALPGRRLPLAFTRTFDDPTGGAIWSAVSRSSEVDHGR